MISDTRTKCWLIRPLLALLVTAGANVMAAGGLAIDSVTVSAADDVRIEILFSCPNRYLDYYPQGETDVLQINLLRMEQCDSLNLRSDRQEVDAPGNSALASLASIEYESQREDDAVLRIRFARPVQAVVSQSGDQRSLSITVEPNHPVTAPPPLYTPTATLPVTGTDPEAQGAGSGVALCTSAGKKCPRTGPRPHLRWSQRRGSLRMITPLPRHTGIWARSVRGRSPVRTDSWLVRNGPDALPVPLRW